MTHEVLAPSEFIYGKFENRGLTKNEIAALVKIDNFLALEEQQMKPEILDALGFVNFITTLSTKEKDEIRLSIASKGSVKHRLFKNLSLIRFDAGKFAKLELLKSELDALKKIEGFLFEHTRAIFLNRFRTLIGKFLFKYVKRVNLETLESLKLVEFLTTLRDQQKDDIRLYIINRETESFQLAVRLYYTQLD